MRKNTQVCFIGGAGHSGSTLLGLVLGAHPQVFYAGEANKSRGLGDASVKLRKRTCKVCGESCRVWSAISAGVPGKPGRHNCVGSALRTTPVEISASEPDLYEALSLRTGRSVIADSTKSIAWIDEQNGKLAARGVALHLFFLGRDGRAVVASGLRKHPETSASEHARAWVEQIAATEALVSRFPGGVTRVRYERLASQPDEVIAGVAKALGLDVVAAMREPWTAEQHPLGGNAGTQSLLETRRDDLAIGGAKKDYYASHPRGFVLDLRWKKELSSDALAAFDDIAGETNRPYAWEDAS
jgi:hypothetical protein